MQVRTIDGGRGAFNAMLYNVPDNTTLQWLNNNINQARSVLGGVANTLVDASVNLYNKVNGNAAINAAKELVTSQGGHSNQYMVYGLTCDSMPEANYIMQQYIMANPNVSELYANNLCHGFEETYYNQEPGVTGVDRLDYQRVMDGVAYEGEDCLMVAHYSNTDPTELSVGDQNLILDTWAQVDHMILNGVDPTDPESGEL